MGPLKTKYYKFAIFLIVGISGVLLAPDLLSQAPTHYPSGNNPLKLNAKEIILYIVMPVLMVVFYIWYQRKRKKDDKK